VVYTYLAGMTEGWSRKKQLVEAPRLAPAES
jgi:hypothetical protein